MVLLPEHLCYLCGYAFFGGLRLSLCIMVDGHEEWAGFKGFNSIIKLDSNPLQGLRNRLLTCHACPNTHSFQQSIRRTMWCLCCGCNVFAIFVQFICNIFQCFAIYLIYFFNVFAIYLQCFCNIFAMYLQCIVMLLYINACKYNTYMFMLNNETEMRLNC